jgi:hypothetical protein
VRACVCRGLGRGKATTVPAWMTSTGGVSSPTNVSKVSNPAGPAANTPKDGQIIAAIVEALRAQGPIRTLEQALSALDKLGIRHEILLSSVLSPGSRRESFDDPATKSLPYPTPASRGGGMVKPLPNGPGYVPDLGGDEDEDEVVLDDDDDGDDYNEAPAAGTYQHPQRQAHRPAAQFNRPKQPGAKGRMAPNSFKPNFKNNNANKRPFNGPVKNGKRQNYFAGN